MNVNTSVISLGMNSGSPLKKGVLGTVSVRSSTIWMRCGSNRAWACMYCVRDHCTQTRSCAAVVFDRRSCLNQNMAVEDRCLSWKAGQMIVVGVTKVKNNMHVRFVLQVLQLLSSSSPLAVHKPTLCILQLVLDYAVHMQECLGAHQND